MDLQAYLAHMILQNVPSIIMPQKYFTATVLSSSEHRCVHGSYKNNNNKKGWLKTCVKFDTFATHAALFVTSLISALQTTMYTAGHKMTECSLTVILPTVPQSCFHDIQTDSVVILVHHMINQHCSTELLLY